MASLLKRFFIFATLCVAGQISFGQESYPKHCSAACLEYSKSYSAQNSEPYQDYCAINWGQIKNLSVDSRKSDASAFARDVASGRGTLRDKALHCLYSGVESGNVPNGSRVGVANSAKPNVDNRSTDQSQQNQSSQQQSQQAQQQAQQAQEAARVAQTRADQARKEQRRRHEPENEASHCIQPDFGGLYGGMKNTCNFKVWYTYCGFRPKENSWLTGMSCEKQSFGSDSVSPGRTSASHTKGVEAIHWIACKEPAWTVDTEFVAGKGISGRCYTVGGK